MIAESSLGRRAVLGELYARGWTIDDVIPALTKLRAEHGVEELFADPSEPAYIRQCREAGLSMVAATNDVLPGISCVGLLGEIPGYVWKRDRATGLTIDVPVKVGDDGCDALRYGCMGLGDGGLRRVLPRRDRATAGGPRRTEPVTPGHLLDSCQTR